MNSTEETWLRHLISAPPPHRALCQATLSQRSSKSLTAPLVPSLPFSTWVKCLLSFSPTGMRKQTEGQWVETHSCGAGGGERRQMRFDNWPWQRGQADFPASGRRYGWGRGQPRKEGRGLREWIGRQAVCRGNTTSRVSLNAFKTLPLGCRPCLYPPFFSSLRMLSRGYLLLVLPFGGTFWAEGS